MPLLDETIDAPAQVATINDALYRLNSVLFGPQEYAIVAARRLVSSMACRRTIDRGGKNCHPKGHSRFSRVDAGQRP